MCVSLEVVLGTTTIAMLGPGLALRGPDGSMHGAVDGILREFEALTRLFHFMAICFIGTTVAFAWSAAAPTYRCSLELTLLCAAVAWVMIKRRGAVEAAFPLTSTPLVSGAFFERAETKAAPSADQSWAALHSPLSGRGATPKIGQRLARPSSRPARRKRRRPAACW